MAKKTYNVGLVCDNCEDELDIEIPMGTEAERYCEKTTCPTCGCLGLHKPKKNVLEFPFNISGLTPWLKKNVPMCNKPSDKAQH